ncbi:MAG TPA: hypothetical protein VGY55_14920 [Pirellulales bacterium]|jgi:hypothetical protein|nr:hypothetical protein [Pirellulales bacterium]
MKCAAVAIVLASVLVAGCGGDEPTPASRGPVNKTNFDAIHEGMAQIQVVQMLGRWTAAAPSVVKINGADMAVKHCQWKRDTVEIDVNFADDKVVSKSEQGL